MTQKSKYVRRCVQSTDDEKLKINFRGKQR